MGKKELDDLRKKVNDALGLKEETLMSMSTSDPSMVIRDGLSSGSLMLNLSMSGNPFVGYVWGRIAEIYGPESCVDESTFIKYVAYDDRGKSHFEGGSISHLYNLLHGDGEESKYDYYVTSINDFERTVISNKLSDVVSTGRKPCFEVVSRLGKKLICTEDHKLFNGTDFIPLKSLSVGDTIYSHTNVRSTGKGDHDRYFELYVKYHPAENRKTIHVKDKKSGKKYTYIRYRLKRSHAVIEANRNGISYSDYLSLLNSGDVSKIRTMWTIPKGSHVHHKDMDRRNDTIENLELKEGRYEAMIHNREHALENDSKLRYIVVPDEIVSIEPVGDRNTYDIKCIFPFNNFIANGIVVHNSGKTTLALHAVHEAQKREDITGNLIPCLYIDVEHALDRDYAEQIGIDMDRLIIAQPDYGEIALSVAEKAVQSGFKVVVLDSVAALVPRAEAEGEMGEAHVGLRARLMSQACRKLTPIVQKNGALLIFINQIRMKIGVVFGNPETRPGGNALKYAATYILDVRSPRSGKMTAKTLIGYGTQGEDSETVEVATKMNITTRKNKVFPPHRSAKAVIEYGKGIDRVRDIIAFLEYSQAFSVVKRSKSQTPVLRIPSKNKSFGVKALSNLLKEEPELTDEIFDIIEAREELRRK